MDWWQDLIQQNYDWLWEAGLTSLITLIASLTWHYLSKKLDKLIVKSKNRWDDIVLNSFAVPVNWLIIIIGASWFADITARHFSAEIIDSIPVARQLAVLVIIAWGTWRLITGIEEKQLDKGNDPTTVQLVGKVTKLTVVILIIMPIFQILGISISGMLAFGGMGGLIVGMAAKDLLANFFGSIIIYLDKPFIVGEWIRSPDRSIEGTVEKIGFRLTVIRTFDKRPLYVPNAVFTNISVENPSRMKNRRIKETIGVRYKDAQKLPIILDEVRTMLVEHNDIDNDQTLIVNFDTFGASSLEFFIYTFTKTTNWIEYHHIKQDVMLKILNIIHSHDADCAFPTRTLHVESMPDGATNT
ncbi:MAG TPA: mechanosensitive ion channel protein MscS [Oceanospirillales bacterium]|jgi:MscS family membrane protein|nr:mechanosensitive ion channel protein MscS [Oceanospirillales bacterium]|tara:strand:- start:5083 stop:6150 length:1068 start_codon:yes stop_codon:yes gene_type:complete